MSKNSKRSQKAAIERKRDWADAEEPDEQRFDGDIPTEEYAGMDTYTHDAQEFRS